ncbi:MAG: metallophosphoesterase [Lachnospiraceae bacterium]|nr:metallophosphoesterase [Lachnospiraceae bacterium]
MRILVISDSHGKNDDVKRVIEQVGEIDMFIHLGDVEKNVDYVRELAGCETHMVLGNNDFFLDLPHQDSFEIAGKKVFITHGHRFYVAYGVDKLREYALENGYDIVMFGHTHRPYLEIGEKVTILNPGSISYPRQDGRKCTYMLIEVDREGELHYSRGILKSSLGMFYEELFK